MKKGKPIDISLHLPAETALLLSQLAKQGVLGSTVEDVVQHILRDYMFKLTMRHGAAKPTKLTYTTR